MNTHLSALLASTIAGSALLFGAAAAQATALPTCSQPSNCLVFGDFSVYSLPFLNFNATGSTSQTPSNPYYVASSPGQISDYIVYGTGTNNNGVNNNPAGMDNAETMPTGGSPSYFSTQIVPDPTGDTFVGDAATTWDARVSSIRDYLTTNNSDFVIYFNLNETGQSDQLDGLNMLAWAEFTLKDDDGLLPDLHYFLTGPSSYFDATGSASALSLSASNGGPTVNTTADGGVDASDTRWTELH
jgi:hypothetical protein